MRPRGRGQSGRLWKGDVSTAWVYTKIAYSETSRVLLQHLSSARPNHAFWAPVATDIIACGTSAVITFFSRSFSGATCFRFFGGSTTAFCRSSCTGGCTTAQLAPYPPPPESAAMACESHPTDAAHQNHSHATFAPSFSWIVWTCTAPAPGGAEIGCEPN